MNKSIKLKLSMLILCAFFTLTSIYSKVNTEPVSGNEYISKVNTEPVSGNEYISEVNTESVSGNQYLGSKSPYPEPGDVKYTEAPAGYKESFIYLLNRHGSRNLSSYKYDKTWVELLTIAEKEGQITDMGKTLLVEMQAIVEWEDGKYGLLTKSGAAELVGIGQRTGEHFKELFATGAPISADNTYITRTSETRESFIEGLRSTGYKGEVTAVVYEKEADPYLRPLDIAPKYSEFKEDGPWKARHKAFSNNATAGKMAERIISQFISDSFVARLADGEFQLEDAKGRVKLDDISSAATNLYNCYIILPAIKGDGFTGADFKRYFTDAELEMWENLQSAKSFNTYGPGHDESSGIAASIAAPNVKRMINVIDESISGEAAYLGVFSFAHGETITPLLNMLEVEDCNVGNNDLEEAVNNWKNSHYSPMGSNFQWVIYTAPNKEPLLKVLFNEKESTLSKNIKLFNGPYYKWSDVKDYYSQKIGKLGITLDSDFDDNIKSLKDNF